MAICSPFSDPKARLLSLTKVRKSRFLVIAEGLSLHSLGSERVVCEQFQIAGSRCTNRVEFSSRPTSTEFVHLGGQNFNDATHSGCVVGKPEVICPGWGLVTGSRLVGSDLPAWHRFRRTRKLSRPGSPVLADRRTPGRGNRASL